MPSVGMRRSTRIFVPKSVGKSGESGKVLRSGKRVLLEFDEGKQGRRNKVEHFHLVDTSDEIVPLPCYKSNGWRKVIPEQDVNVTDVNATIETSEPKSEPEPEPVSVVNMPSVSQRRYRNVYDRKRRRSLDNNNSKPKEDRLLRTFYVRKKMRKSNTASEISGSKNVFFGQERSSTLVPVPTLDVKVESSPGSSSRFTCFLVSVLKYMMSSHVTLSGLAAFMCRKPIVQVFSRHGVHFTPGFSPGTSLANDTISSGFCRFFGDHTFIPLFWLDFSVVPLLFRNLNSIVFFRSLYISHKHSCFLIGLINKLHDEEGKSHPAETNLPQSSSIASGNSSMKNLNTNFALDGSELDLGRVSTRNTVSQKFQRKRSSLRSKRVKSPTMGFQHNSHFNLNNQIKINSYDKKSCDPVGLDSLGVKTLAAPGCNQKQTGHVHSNLSHNHKEVTPTLDGLRQNIDSLQCKANVLVIESDRCYREEGATVMLECSASKVWHVVVKTQGLAKYMHPAQEVMRPSTTNRFTHAMIWTAENGFKLEFCDRNDWVVFKELHKECVSKNLEANSAKTIPVPGVREILNYDVGEYTPFSRPISYITFHNNEVTRALVKGTATYDIQLDDEQWLENLNSARWNGGDEDTAGQLSVEKFEEIIDVLEKAAYHSPHDVFDKSKFTSFCSYLGRGDIIADVYEYWLQKRKQKQAALLRVFECQPPRKAPPFQDNVLRKKRSFKKHGSQNGRGQQQYNDEGMFVEQKEVAMNRVQEAQTKAKEALAAALGKRKRAQELMENADLATYLAIMSVEIAKSTRLTEIVDAQSTEIGDGPLSWPTW